MSGEVIVLIDHFQGSPVAASLESLALGQRLASEAGGPVSALVLGSDTEGVVDNLSGYRLDNIYNVPSEELDQYDPARYCSALEAVLEQKAPRLLVMAHIYQNIDLAPKLAARIESGLVTDCIGFKRGEDDSLVFVRKMFHNKLNADVSIDSEPPWIVTMQAGAFSRDDIEAGEGASVSSLELGDLPEPARETLESFEATKGKVDLSKAEVIVAVGRGIKKEENLELIERLAEVLDAEIGASRPVVDNEWLGRERQIGSSGQNVSPKLYVGVGISGAIQHLVGMKSSQCIVAINTDSNAPIFNVATYGIVGDLFEVVPVLIEKIKANE